jgi:hypothetical protein
LQGQITGHSNHLFYDWINLLQKVGELYYDGEGNSIFLKLILLNYEFYKRGLNLDLIHKNFHRFLFITKENAKPLLDAFEILKNSDASTQFLRKAENLDFTKQSNFFRFANPPKEGEFSSSQEEFKGMYD